ncbi:hypothetical protein FGIG_11632 [Fasciola gigantica]|uniref:Uncharacterized protein n=1 Tax=Fasciola gigantica TaxID=46835 RepID=A0A504YNF8_FASGI|nr:hypothetical protein FGIG_11632 [Fasciola gigantica]
MLTYLLVLTIASGLLSAEFSWQTKSRIQRAHELARKHLSSAY